MAEIVFIYVCSLCKSLNILCSVCYTGHKYCPECSVKKRKSDIRKAKRQYRSSTEAKIKQKLRQRARRRRLGPNVTEQSIEKKVKPESIEVIELESKTVDTWPQGHESFWVAHCALCGKPVAVLVFTKRGVGGQELGQKMRRYGRGKALAQTIIGLPLVQ